MLEKPSENTFTHIHHILTLPVLILMGLIIILLVSYLIRKAYIQRRRTLYQEVREFTRDLNQTYEVIHVVPYPLTSTVVPPPV